VHLLVQINKLLETLLIFEFLFKCKERLFLTVQFGIFFILVFLS